MLGNFSVGDYFKEGAITFAWELSTRRLKIPADQIWVTIYPDDDEAYALWQKIARIPAERIVRLEDNWWGPAGETGPCGPDSELYLDRGPDFGCGRPDCRPGCDCARFLEFWNLVFMQFYQDANKVRTPLPRKHIDTGMGLERATMLLQGQKSVYETDLFRPIIAKGEELVGVAYGADSKIDFSLRVLADHSRAATFLIADGVLPGNEGRGYILRRILRRAIRHGRMMGLERPFLGETAKTVIDLMGDAYPELVDRESFILKVIGIEESKFSQTLAVGLRYLSEVIDKLRAQGAQEIPGQDAFRLYDTFGFPKELTAEVAGENRLSVDLAGFDRAMEKQRETGRAAAKFGLGPKQAVEAYEQLAVGETPFLCYQTIETDTRVVGIVSNGRPVEKALAGQEVEIVLEQSPFYPEGGGQVGDTGWITGEGGKARVSDTQRPLPTIISHRAVVAEGYVEVGDSVHAKVDGARRQAIARHHTSTHLLHKALHAVLGPHAQQAGSLVSPDRLRFDFAHLTALSREEMAEVERLVNESIRANYDVVTKVTNYSEAMSEGAVALFGEKYGETVRMVVIDDYSRELCGGTHVGRTGDIGTFIILGESSIGSGWRRIEALAGRAADEYVAEQRAVLDRLSQRLETKRVEERVSSLLGKIEAEPVG
ncbi:MAG: alanine--tRNA ligase [Chloroflexi bacterium]|nr:alanine--tRNA ligase [Chloroflexota bacterium]